MVITVPSLASLELIIQHGCYEDGFSVCKAASLDKASIYIRYNEYFSMKNQRGLLGDLFNMTSLELTHFETMGALNKNLDGFSIFPNMRALSLESCFLDDDCDMDSRLDDLGSFLENSPCLEKLTLRCCRFCTDSGWE